jgi:O-antigen/teichoic acid export membrane protein
MVVSSLISACCGVILTFCVPKFLSVDDFGIWRAFLLYAGYAGLLHLGLIDGALLIWSRDESSRSNLLPRSISPLRTLLGRAQRFLILEHLMVFAMAAAAFLLFSRPTFPLVLMALAGYGMLFNLVGLLQVYLQTGFRFSAVAFGMSGPPVLFVLSLGILALTHVTVARLLAAYLTAWAVTLAGLLWVTYARSAKQPELDDLKPAKPELPSPELPNLNVPGGIESAQLASSEPISSWRIGLAYIAAGWPIVLANTGFGLMQSADRVTVNITRPLHDFAIYSLSQSTIYVPITILAAVSRVTFSWFARALASGRAALYRSSTRLLALLWMLLLPYYFVVELVVQRFLPRYVPGLAAGRILLLSVLFLSLIQIVQLNTYSLEGRQRQFFTGSLMAVAAAFATAWIGSQVIGTLTAVAWSQVLTAALWWLGNQWFLRRQKLLRGRDILTVLATFCLATAGLYIGSLGSQPWSLRVAVYYAISAIPAYFLFREEILVLVHRASPRVLHKP